MKKNNLHVSVLFSILIIFIVLVVLIMPKVSNAWPGVIGG
jgi:hypothetical protein